VGGTSYGQDRRATDAVELHVHKGVVNAVLTVLFHDRRQGDANRIAGPLALGRERQDAFPEVRAEFLRAHRGVDEAPFDRALSAHAIRRRAEDVGVIPADTSLVDETRETPGARQHAEQRNLRQAHG
jgi:hypothetical protein